MPDDFPNYMHHSKLLEYFRLYADHFRLQQYIRFETEVTSVEQQLGGGGRWSLTTRNTKDSSDAATEVFDAVMVCVGNHSSRNMPSFDRQDEFKGELIHSVNYRQAQTSYLNVSKSGRTLGIILRPRFLNRESELNVA